jgi:signal transduction histidine kinase
VAFIQHFEGGRLGQDPNRELRQTERLRLAHDLHDGPIQTVAGAVLELELLQRLARANEGVDGDVLASLQGARDATRRVLEDLRSIVRSLTGPPDQGSDRTRDAEMTS